MVGRHRWGDKVRFPYKTEQSCLKCALVKATHHQPDGTHMTEFWRGLDLVSKDATPACEPVMTEASS